MTDPQTAMRAAREALARAEFAMSFNQWNWNSSASDDMKREVYQGVKVALAQLDDAIDAALDPQPKETRR